MKITPSYVIRHKEARPGIFLLVVALLVAIVGYGGTCGTYNPTPSENLEIRTWYDLDDVRDNLGGNHILMNNLDSTTLGYEELASPTANEGKGWQPIGFPTPHGSTAYVGFWGTFDGQGYEIRDVYINRPDEDEVGLFGGTDQNGVIQNIGVMAATVTGDVGVGCLVGASYGTVSDSYSNGNVTGNVNVGGLVGGNGWGTVSDSYSTGSVTGDENVGGLVGSHADIVRNSYSSCNVTGNSCVGGLVGYSYGRDTTVSNSFWDTETSGQSTSDGGTGMNTTAMQNIATFSGAGWTIIAVALNETNPAYTWNIVNNVTYPFLGWQS